MLNSGVWPKKEQNNCCCAQALGCSDDVNVFARGPAAECPSGARDALLLAQRFCALTNNSIQPGSAVHSAELCDIDNIDGGQAGVSGSVRAELTSRQQKDTRHALPS